MIYSVCLVMDKELKYWSILGFVLAVAYARGGGSTPFGDGTGSEDLSFYFNDPLLLRTELAEIANMSLLFNSPV